MNFFFDNTLAPKIARGLNQFVQPEHSVVHLKDAFEPNDEDEYWLSELAKRLERVAIVTADVHIERNPHLIQAWGETGHTIFFLKPGWADMPFWLQTQKLTTSFPAMLAAASDAHARAAFLVSPNGRIRQLR